MHRFRSWTLDPPEYRTQRNRLLPIEGGDGSTLNLDFTTGVLDPRLTFTRSTNATFINSSGLVQWAANNMVIRSQDYTNSAWSKFRIDTTSSGLNVANTTLAPDGSNTGLLIKADAATGTHRVLQSNGTTGSTFLSNNGFTIITLSAFFKANGSNFAALKISNSIESRGVTRTFNLTNGVVSGIEDATWVCTNASATSVGNGWYRCQITASISRVDANDDQLGMWLFVANGADIADRSFTNSSASVWAWGAQAELASSAGGYNATTTATYQAPRFDHDPTSIGTPRGLLIEGTGTNSVFRSQALNTSPWSKAGVVSISETGSGSPANDSTSNVLTWTNSTTGGNAWLEQSLTVAGSQPYTWSVWLKSRNNQRVSVYGLTKNSGGTIIGNLETTVNFSVSPPTATNTVTSGYTNVTTPTLTAYPNGWYRMVATGTTPATAATTTFGISNKDAVPSTGTNGCEVWGAQFEAGSGASSYIPSGASQGTRNPDYCVMDGISSFFTSQSSLTMLIDATPRFQSGFPALWRLTDAGNSNSYELYYTSSGTNNTYATKVAVGGVSSGESNFANSIAQDTRQIMGYAIASGVGFRSRNGASAAAQIPTSLPSAALTRLGIGSSGLSANPSTAHIRRIKYWPYAMTQAQLNGVTTP